ncbi:MAG: carbohydrate porin [Rhodopila sp.]|nr:carbohydrate porin [Rhodopila sp.]
MARRDNLKRQRHGRHGNRKAARIGRGVACLALLSIAPLYSHEADAQQPPAGAVQPSSGTTAPQFSSFLQNWANQDTATGNWGGVRTSLEDFGINLRGHWTTESAFNPVGGTAEAGAYTQQFDFGADLDLDKLIGLQGGTVQITFVDRGGASLSAEALGNNLFPVQELYGAGNNFRLTDLNYQQNLLDDKITFQIGWSPIGDHFATDPIFCHFQSGAMCGHPKSNSTNDPGWHNFPASQWGARILFRPVDDFYAQTGIYQANPNAGNHDQGFNLSFSGTGVVIPVEVGWTPQHGIGGMPGAFRLGGYYDTSQGKDVLEDAAGQSAVLAGAPFAERNGHWGIYAMATQTVYQEANNPKRGLSLFAIATTADPQTSKMRYFFAAGGSYQGTFANRDDDFVSFLVAYTRINNRLSSSQEDQNTISPGSVGIQRDEAVFEIDYSAAVTKWLSIRPNIQYVMNPAAAGKVPNAFVLGLYTRVTF